MMKSSTQKSVTLSVCEAKQSSGVLCAQDMLYCKNVLKSMGLKVKLPMLFKMDSKGAVDLANNWSVGNRTRHFDVRQWFLRELKESKTMNNRWVKGTENDTYVFTKNLDGPALKKYIKTLVGHDAYMKSPTTSELGGCQEVSYGLGFILCGSGIYRALTFFYKKQKTLYCKRLTIRYNTVSK